jgi:uncharacterized protein (DUF1697 family)
MQTYISILRGINVSGQKLIKMSDLQELFSALGYKNIKTYIQSGNVIFQSTKKNTAALATEISKAITANYQFTVPVLVKSKQEIEETIKHNPFVKRTNIDLSKLHVTFLSATPDAALVSKIADINYDDDEFIVDENIVYLHCPKTYGNTKLSNNYFENKLKVTATTRNWKTVNELFSIAEKTSEGK